MKLKLEYYEIFTDNNYNDYVDKYLVYDTSKLKEITIYVSNDLLSYKAIDSKELTTEQLQKINWDALEYPEEILQSIDNTLIEHTNKYLTQKSFYKVLESYSLSNINDKDNAIYTLLKTLSSFKTHIYIALEQDNLKQDETLKIIKLLNTLELKLITGLISISDVYLYFTKIFGLNIQW